MTQYYRTLDCRDVRLKIEHIPFNNLNVDTVCTDYRYFFIKSKLIISDQFSRLSEFSRD